MSGQEAYKVRPDEEQGHAEPIRLRLVKTAAAAPAPAGRERLDLRAYLPTPRNLRVLLTGVGEGTGVLVGRGWEWLRGEGWDSESAMKAAWDRVRLLRGRDRRAGAVGHLHRLPDPPGGRGVVPGGPSAHRSRRRGPHRDPGGARRGEGPAAQGSQGEDRGGREGGSRRPFQGRAARCPGRSCSPGRRPGERHRGRGRGAGGADRRGDRGGRAPGRRTASPTPRCAPLRPSARTRAPGVGAARPQGRAPGRLGTPRQQLQAHLPGGSRADPGGVRLEHLPAAPAGPGGRGPAGAGEGLALVPSQHPAAGSPEHPAEHPAGARSAAPSGTSSGVAVSPSPSPAPAPSQGTR